MAIIYKIQNKLTGRVYVGHTTTTLQKRMYAHRHRLRSGKHSALQDDYDKHGWDSFEVEVIETVPDSEARQREQIWIEHYGQLSYNQWNSVDPDHKSPAEGYETRMRERLRRRGKTYNIRKADGSPPSIQDVKKQMQDRGLI